SAVPGVPLRARASDHIPKRGGTSAGALSRLRGRSDNRAPLLEHPIRGTTPVGGSGVARSLPIAVPNEREEPFDERGPLGSLPVGGHRLERHGGGHGPRVWHSRQDVLDRVRGCGFVSGRATLRAGRGG